MWGRQCFSLWWCACCSKPFYFSDLVVCSPVLVGKGLESRGYLWLRSVPGKLSTNLLGLHKLAVTAMEQPRQLWSNTYSLMQTWLYSFTHPGWDKTQHFLLWLREKSRAELGQALLAVVWTRMLSCTLMPKLISFTCVSTESCNKAEHKPHTERFWWNRCDLFFPALQYSLCVIIDVPAVV